MRGAIRLTYGSPDVLSIEELEIPKITDNQVLIRVFAATVNRTDCAILTGKPFIMRFFTGLLKPKSPITGTDFAGRIEAIGKNVTTFNIGDNVWGFDDMGLNSHAQYIALSADKAITTIPGNITFEQAAASAEGAHYAYNFINKVNFKACEKVLINGATGAIGSAILQFLKAQNIYVTAVCNSKNIELIKSLGADKIIDYTKDNFTKDDEKYDFVFDAVGKSSFAKCKRLLQPNGIYISSELGEMNQNPFLALITPLLGGKRVIFPVPTDIKRSLNYIKGLLEKDLFKPVIDRRYNLENIAEAYKYVASGNKTGNVVINLED